MILSWQLKECGKPDCFRQVKAGVEYCCAECAAAAEGRYEAAQHSEGCEQRHSERGGYGTKQRPAANSVWPGPFTNEECEAAARYALTNGYPGRTTALSEEPTP